MLIPYNIDFGAKLIKRNSDGYYIQIFFKPLKRYSNHDFSGF